MPRTRRSISSANIALEQVDKNKSPLKSDDMTTSPNCGDILPKENLSLKKRTVSDRSPAIKSRKKTPGQQGGTPPIQNTNSTPIPSQEKNDPVLADKENQTPGPTPYWKVSELVNGWVVWASEWVTFELSIMDEFFSMPCISCGLSTLLWSMHVRVVPDTLYCTCICVLNCRLECSM